MRKQFKREQRYFVVKVKDAKEYLDAHQLEKLAEIADTISEGREKDGIPAVECVVVESDWPEYEPTWKAIEARVTGAQPAPIIPEGWKLVPTAESRHPGIYKMLSALHAVDNTPGASEWESYAAFLAATPKLECE